MWFQLSPERATQIVCFAPSRLCPKPVTTQGSVARYARSSTLGYAAARFQRAFSSVATDALQGSLGCKLKRDLSIGIGHLSMVIFLGLN
jgi:hypothetical protein